MNGKHLRGTIRNEILPHRDEHWNFSCSVFGGEENLLHLELTAVKLRHFRLQEDFGHRSLRYEVDMEDEFSFKF